MTSSRIYKIAPGTLIKIRYAPDQNKLAISRFIGQAGVVIKNLTVDDGITSSTNMYSVLLESGKVETFHYLDFAFIDEKAKV